MSKQVTRRPTKQDLRKERREEQIRREAERKRQQKRRRITIISALVAVAVIAAALISFIVYNNMHGQSQAAQTEPIVNPQYPPVDNIYCDQQEQTAFHIHAHLTMYIDGQAVPLPAQVGIAKDQSCLYWLHTHDTSGVIHIEAPANRSFVLGNFLNEWSTEFPSLNYPPQLDQTGWQVYVNGKLYNGDFHKIPLQAHTLITMAYNTSHVVPDTTYNWNGL